MKNRNKHLTLKKNKYILNTLILKLKTFKNIVEFIFLKETLVELKKVAIFAMLLTKSVHNF